MLRRGGRSARYGRSIRLQDPAPSLSDEACIDEYLQYKFIPWRQVGGCTQVLVCGWRRREWRYLKARFRCARIVPVTSAQFSRALSRRFHARLSRDAVLGLYDQLPRFSARMVCNARQRGLIGTVAGALLLLTCLYPVIALHAVVLFSAAGFCIGIVARFLLALAGTWQEKTPVLSPLVQELPVYTLLVPLFRETAVLEALTQALAALKYPAQKLDIKLIVEADDGPTRQMAQRLEQTAAPVGAYETVIVPASLPRTKPKACNYALRFARGEFTVIYDAEDCPDPDQLLIAVAAFRAASPATACLQARLVIDNPRENLLTALFALDYGIWFSVLLPGLSRLGCPMPLGGTSNHFRTDVLRRAQGWDPFNVTEDADLGLRLAQLGYRVAMLDSVTAEEAPMQMRTWLCQRTRWLKGYMQTLLVHLRTPSRFCSKSGLCTLLSLLLSVGGSVATALLNPVLWLIFVVSLFLKGSGTMPDLTRELAILSGSGLMVANVLLAATVLISVRQHSVLRRLLCCFTMIFYWLMISVAAWRALFQLISCPHLWEKTPHGISRCRTPL